MAYRKEKNEKVNMSANPKWRLHDFADWNMYKNYLFHHGMLNQKLIFKESDWQAYLIKSGKKPD